MFVSILLSIGIIADVSCHRPIIPILVGDKMFFAPVFALSRYDWWRRHFANPVPTHVRPIHVNTEIFGILMEVVTSVNGLTGTEGDINLVHITAAMAMALSFDMQAEFDKLVITFKRFIVQRVMYRNPFQPDMENILDHEYYVYRSEELYRAWSMVVLHEPLARILNPIEIASLYWLVIPGDLWPALTTNFDQQFNTIIDVIALQQPNGPEHHFNEIYQEAFEDAGYVVPAWMEQPPAYHAHHQGAAPAPGHGPASGPANHANVHLPGPFEHTFMPATPLGAEPQQHGPVAHPARVRRDRSRSAPAAMITPPLSEGNTVVNDSGSEESNEAELLAELAESLD